MNARRYIIVARFIGVWLPLFFFSGSALARDWPIGTFYYEITRNKNQTGILKIVSKRQGKDVVVETEEWINDSGYCHASKRSEVWRNGTLVAFESSSAGSCSVFVRLFRPGACPWDEFGDPIKISVVRRDKVLVKTIAGEKGQQIVEEAVPTNFLNPAFRGPNDTVKTISPMTGELESMRVSTKGTEELPIGNTSVQTERYLVQMQDSQDRVLWYDSRGIWIKMFLQRDAVTFAAADPARMESELTSFVSESTCLRSLPRHK